jgi:hypothetical protein
MNLFTRATTYTCLKKFRVESIVSKNLKHLGLLAIMQQFLINQLFQKPIQGFKLIIKFKLAVIDKVDQRGRIFQVEFFQNIIAVYFNCFYRNIQGIRNFF